VEDNFACVTKCAIQSANHYAQALQNSKGTNFPWGKDCCNYMPVRMPALQFCNSLTPVQNQPHFAEAVGEIIRRSISVVGLFKPHKVAAIKQAEMLISGCKQ